MSDWQPIETAPKDTDRRNPVDLWLVNSLRGWRAPDCHECYSEKGTWLNNGGRWVTGGSYRDEHGIERFSPRPLEGYPAQVRATHWMRPPSPPEPD